MFGGVSWVRCGDGGVFYLEFMKFRSSRVFFWLCYVSLCSDVPSLVSDSISLFCIKSFDGLWLLCLHILTSTVYLPYFMESLICLGPIITGSLGHEIRSLITTNCSDQDSHQLWKLNSRLCNMGFQRRTILFVPLLWGMDGVGHIYPKGRTRFRTKRNMDRMGSVGWFMFVSLILFTPTYIPCLE